MTVIAHVAILRVALPYWGWLGDPLVRAERGAGIVGYHWAMSANLGAMSANLVLVGFMGAGKSSVGRILARRLGRCFVETDDMIVARDGRSIPEIFAAKGEAHFRALEDEMLDLLGLKQGEVIATGGGFPCREGRPERLRAVGTVIWLAGDFATLYERARRAGERPMLAGRGREEAEALLRAREPFYRQAHLTVDVGQDGPDRVASRVLTAVGAFERPAVV
jgi:shikimate kinase